MHRDVMAYDPEKHHRRSVRLRGYNYAAPGAYFVTLCAHDRACLFGDVIEGRMQLSAIGQIVEEEWRRSTDIRAEIEMDAFIFMPNHVHGIVVIALEGTEGTVDPRGYKAYLGAGVTPNVGAHGRAPLPADGNRLHRKPKSLGAFVAGFKAAATARVNRMRGTPGAKVWQPRYHDRVVCGERSDRSRETPGDWCCRDTMHRVPTGCILHDEREWHAVRRYIRQNPKCWHEDANHPTRL